MKSLYCDTFLLYVSCLYVKRTRQELNATLWGQVLLNSPHLIVEIRHFMVEYHDLYVFMESCQQVFLWYLLQKKIMDISARVAGLPGRHIMQKVMLLCFRLMFLAVCKVGVIHSAPTLPGAGNQWTYSMPLVATNVDTHRSLLATARNCFQQPPQD